MLAHNLLVSLRVLDPARRPAELAPDLDHTPSLLTVPVTVSTHARYTVVLHLRADRMDALVAIVFGPVAAQAQGGPAGDGGG